MVVFDGKIFVRDFFQNGFSETRQMAGGSIRLNSQIIIIALNKLSFKCRSVFIQRPELQNFLRL